MSEILISLAAAVIAALCGWVVKSLVPFIKSKLTLSVRADIENWVKIATGAAEQMFKGSGKGKEKFDYVCQLLMIIGAEIEFEEMKALIEREVYELNLRRPVAPIVMSEADLGALFNSEDSE